MNMSLVMEGIQFKIISKNLITAAYEKSSLNFGEIVNYFNINNIKIVDYSQFKAGLLKTYQMCYSRSNYFTNANELLDNTWKS